MYIGWLHIKGNERPYRVKFDTPLDRSELGFILFTRLKQNDEESALLINADEIISLDYNNNVVDLKD